jgi:hypothetical protein
MNDANDIGWSSLRFFGFLCFMLINPSYLQPEAINHSFVLRAAMHKFLPSDTTILVDDFEEIRGHLQQHERGYHTS